MKMDPDRFAKDIQSDSKGVRAAAWAQLLLLAAYGLLLAGGGIYVLVLLMRI